MRRYRFTSLILILVLVSCATQGPQVVNSIRFFEPAQSLLTNQDVLIQLEVKGSKENIELFINQTFVRTLSYPYRFTWDIQDWQDGRYTLEAQNTLAKSNALEIRLDRKAPHIMLLQPLATTNAFNLADPIMFELDEAVAADTLGNYIQVTDSNHKVLSTTIEYKNNRVSIQLKESPSLPTTLTLSVKALPDPAGNSVSAAWSWSVPLWHSTGPALNVNPKQNANEPFVTVNHHHQPVVAWEEASNIYVKSWTAQGWQLLGGQLNRAPAHGPVLASSSERLYAAWAEGETQSDIIVKAWTGKDWEHLGTVADDIADHDTARPSLAMVNDMPVIAFFEFDGQSSNVYVKRWNGNTWEKLEDSLDMVLSQNAVFPSIAISGTQPVVSWFERQGEKSFVYVKQWNGQTWELLGQALNQDSSKAYHPRIATDSSGNVYVSWFEFSTNYRVYVKRWNGNTWESMGNAINTNLSQDAAYPVIAWQNEKLAVSWFEMGATRDEVFLKMWENQTWQIVPISSVSSTAFVTYPSLALDPNGYPILAWRESDSNGQNSQIYAQRYNGLLP